MSACSNRDGVCSLFSKTCVLKYNSSYLPNELTALFIYILLQEKRVLQVLMRRKRLVSCTFIKLFKPCYIDKNSVYYSHYFNGTGLTYFLVVFKTACVLHLSHCGILPAFIFSLLYFLKRPVRTADNLTTFMCRLPLCLGNSTSWKPQGLSRPVMGLLFIFTFLPSLKLKATVNKSQNRIPFLALQFRTY